jgi:hypothetical protein
MIGSQRRSAGSLDQEKRTMFIRCRIAATIVWVDMSIVLLSWTAILRARGDLAPSPAGRSDPPRRRGAGDLIERLCSETGREADR